MALSQKEFEQLKQGLAIKKQRKEKADRPLSQKFLEAGAKFSGAKSAVQLAAPAVEAFSLIGSFLGGESGKKFRQKRLLGQPLGEASRVAEEEGVGAGIKKITGQTLQTAAEAAPFTKGGLGITLTGKALAGNRLLNFANSFVGRSAEISFAKSVGKGIQDGDETGEILMEASVSGLQAAAISFLLGKFGEKIISGFKRSSTKLTGRALETRAKQVQNDIERGRKTLNTKITEEGYRGTSEQIRKQAVANKSKFAKFIDALLRKSPTKILKADIQNNLDDILADKINLGLLSEREVAAIQSKIDDIPQIMSLEDANVLKIFFAEKVPKNAWDLTASQADTVRGELFKNLSGLFRKEIEKQTVGVGTKIGGLNISQLNEKWALASDVLSLIGKKLAKAEVSGGLAESVGGGPFGTIVRAVTAPFTATVTRTTRAQVLNALAKAGATDLADQLAKILIIKGTSK